MTNEAADGPVPVPGRFAGRTVLVTGGGSGIGRAIAARTVAEGASVVVADVDLDAARAVAAELDGAGAVRAVHLDQADERSADAVVGGLDRLDALFANAGTALPARSLVDTSPDAWRRVHSVNLEGAFLIARAAAPLLMRERGAIVFTGSTSGLLAHPGAGAYAASKFGLIGLSRTLAVELVPHGVRVNCVCPGGVRTPLLEAVDPGIDVEAEDVTPLGPLAAPEDVAAAAAFLASSDARHITAAELVVDGGHSAATRRG